MSAVDQGRVQARLPHEGDWAALRLDTRGTGAVPVVDVLVPVYQGHEQTMRCLFSVLAAPQETPFRLVVVDDCSPDPRLREELALRVRTGAFDLVTLPTNLGFVGACNTGLVLHPERDVVLLNSDTEVHGDWLDRLRRCAYSAPDVGTVTPLSNNATICSYPYFLDDHPQALEIDDATLDTLCAHVNDGAHLDLPTGVGFCWYLRRDCLKDVGLLDLERFGKGYGEENDLCRRAARAGWRNLLAADVFVRHYGGISFGAQKQARMEAAIRTVEALHPGYQAIVGDFVRRDPVYALRRRIDLARLARHVGPESVLFVSHRRGGGVEAHVSDLRRLLHRQGTATLLCQPAAGVTGAVEILSEGLDAMPNLRFTLTHDLPAFVEALGILKVQALHIHHLADAPPFAGDFFRMAAQRAVVPYDFTVHDYLPACPRINMVDRSGVYCGEPSEAECDICLRLQPLPFPTESIWQWREQYQRLLGGARACIVPDRDVAERMRRYFPAVNFEVRLPPGEGLLRPGHRPVKVRRGRRRVALLGALGEIKGSALLASVALHVREHRLPLEFVVVGYTDRDSELRSLGVDVRGPYAREDAVGLLRDVQADLVWFSSICPETYCYTLSSALDAGVYPVAFDLGAIASRLRAQRWGELLPLALMQDPAALAQALLQIVPQQAVQPEHDEAVAQ